MLHTHQGKGWLAYRGIIYKVMDGNTDVHQRVVLAHCLIDFNFQLNLLMN